MDRRILLLFLIVQLTKIKGASILKDGRKAGDSTPGNVAAKLKMDDDDEKRVDSNIERAALPAGEAGEECDANCVRNAANLVGNPGAKDKTADVRDAEDVGNPRAKDDSTTYATIQPPSSTSWGSWGITQYCPAGSYAGAARLRVEKYQGSGDETSVNTVELRCTTISSHITSSVGFWGDWTEWHACPSFIDGARIRSQKPGGDDAAVTNVQFHCTDGSKTNEWRGTSQDWGDWQDWKYCSKNQAVCGIQTQVEPNQGSYRDDSALNGIILSCCDRVG